MSRRARATAVYATLRALGRSGVAEIAERDCEMAQLLAEGVRMIPGAEVLNEVDLNQVLVRLHDPAGLDDDAHTRAALTRLQDSGVAYPSGTTFRGWAAIRFSIANWATDQTDVVETLEALADAHTRWA
jgi:glutamate/tyrosine decarboxylase-like PLP-dependent enzyme